MTCEKCNDTGYILTEHAGGISGAEKCNCLLAATQQGLKERANIPDAYKTASLDNFKLPENNPIARTQCAKAMITVRAYVKAFPDAFPPGLLFIGSSGSGKTHLAVATLRELLDKGFEGVYFSFSKLIDHIRAGFNATAGTMDRAAYSRAETTKVLVLDDLGAHRIQPWEQDVITDIISERYNNRLPTIFTTNLSDTSAGDSDEQWRQSMEEQKARSAMRTATLEETIGVRSHSRLFEMCSIIRMDSPDYRKIIATSQRPPR
jgi:DNA replication protein DnaC